MDYFILPGIVGVAAALLIARLLFFTVRIDGNSMQPALLEGETVLVLRLWPMTLLKRNQIIITRMEKATWSDVNVMTDGTYIKRIVGLPGDKITARIDDLPIPLQRKLQGHFKQNGLKHWRIPPNHYFIKGDSKGLDSTVVGPVAHSEFVGLVLTKLPFPKRKRS